MPTDIMEYNEKGLVHGSWETYHYNGQLSFKGYYINGEKHGPWVTFYFNGELAFEGTFDLGKRIGLWTEGIQKIFYAD